MTAVYQRRASESLACALLALAGLGQEPADGIAKLIDQLQDDRTRGRAIESLVRLGESAVPPLTGLLSGPDRRNLAQKKAVLSVLARLGREGAECLDFLATYGLDCELQLLPALARAIADIAPYGKVPASVLAADLSVMKQRSSAREGWERTMIQLTPDILRERMSVDPDASTEHLIWILKSSRPYQREVAAEELGRRRATDAIGPLSQLLAEGEPRRAGADRAFLVGTRRQGRDDFPARAARALLAIDPEDPRVLVAYAYQLINDEDLQTRLRAAMAMGRFGPQAAPAVNDLLLALWDEDIAVIREVVTALGMIGPEARDALPTLENLVEHEDRQIAARAKAALRRIRK
jgi:HEAT repeat protein